MTKLSSAELAVSENGILAYLPGMVPRQLVELDRAGGVRVLRVPPGAYTNPRYSPDGGKVALAVGEPPVIDVWIFDTLATTMRPLTNNHKVARAEWTPDGRRVAWTQAVTARGIHWRAADLSDAESPLLLGGLGMAFSAGHSSSGNYFVTGLLDPNGRRALNVVQLDFTQRRTPIPESDGAFAPGISHDGRWLAYLSAESGRAELYVRSISGLGGRYPISAGGASEPAWNPRGSELFYRVGSSLIAATLEFSPEPRVVRYDTLSFAITTPADPDGASYDVSADGRRFLMARPVAGSSPPIIITGWLEAVRARLKAGR